MATVHELATTKQLVVAPLLPPDYPAQVNQWRVMQARYDQRDA